MLVREEDREKMQCDNTTQTSVLNYLSEYNKII